jgi:MFS family permease
VFGEQLSVTKTAAMGSNVKLSTLWEPRCRHALIACLGVIIFQQITGQPSVLYYADSIFADVGLSSTSSIYVGIFKLLATLVAVFKADSFGRKKLLYAGCLLMLVALAVLGVAFLFEYVSAENCEANKTQVKKKKKCRKFTIVLLLLSACL